MTIGKLTQEIHYLKTLGSILTIRAESRGHEPNLQT